MEEQDDPFDFLLKVSEIPRPQEDLLRASAFTGEPVDAAENAPPCSSGIPPEPKPVDQEPEPEDQDQVPDAPLIMFSLPDTQYDPEKVAAGGSGTQEQDDVFHTPPEKSSYPSSGDMPPSEPCKLNHEIDANDDETLGFVDLDDSQGKGCVNLGRDSELGFSEVQLSQRVEGELVAQSPQGVKRRVVAEEFEGFEKEACISELLVKKSKLTEPNLGLGSSRACLGVESKELEECNGNCNVGADVEHEKVDLAEEQVTKDNEVPVQKNLGSCHGNEANESGCGKEGQKINKNFVFDVLNFLAENLAHDDEDAKNDENDGENANLEDLVKICGIDFPRPRWWQDTDLFTKGKL